MRIETRLPAWMPTEATCHRGCPWLDLAAGLRELGYAPIPLGPSRTPLVKWQRFHVEAPGWRELFNDWWPGLWAAAAGVGLVSGRPHGLVVVDFDSEDAWQWALAHLPAVRGVRSRRGGHLHFRHPSRGIVGNRSGERAVEVVPGVRADVKGLAGLAVAPYSHHPSGVVYQPIGDWTAPVSALPELPDRIRRQAEDRPPPPARPTLRRRGGDPARVLGSYLCKVGGLPDVGAGSDEAVFRAAVWSRHHAPELREDEFVAAVRRERPEWDERWIAAKWRSAKRRA